MKKNQWIIFTITALLLPTIAYAMPEPPGGNKSSASISYNGNTTITSNTTETNQTYSSTIGGQNALLILGGTSTFDNLMITKSGDTSDENSDFYGTNAGILVYNGATLNINGGNITTNGVHANAIFSYGSGKINVQNIDINTTGNNSGGLMVTGGGTLTATNVTVKTTGNSSAAIRSDRGGGTLTVEGGTYETNGVGSPAIYSTADITVNNASLLSTASEGVIVEGANSITLNQVTLTDTNNTLNGNSETYKNIFLYQSMSGDADDGNSSFSAKDSTITTNQGDTIFVTNTTATVTLENNVFINNSGDFLRIQKGKWGNSGFNGGHVTLVMNNQKANGNIVVDSISTLSLSLMDGSVFTGAIDTNHEAKQIDITLSNDSILSLSDDTYVDSLINHDSSNSNIYLNGHSLYVNGISIRANTGSYDENDTTSEVQIEQTQNKNSTTKIQSYYVYLIGGIIVVIIICISAIIMLKKKQNNNRKEANL